MEKLQNPHLGSKSLASLLKTRENARTKLSDPKSGVPAAALKAQVDQEMARRFPGPCDGWSAGKQGEPRFLRRDGQVIAIVIRLESHGLTKGSYLIEVMGRELSETPRGIDEAKALAEIVLLKSEEG